MHIKELPMFTYNLWMGFLHPDTSCLLLCPVINIVMSNNFKLSHVHFTFFSVTKLNLAIQALSLDYTFLLRGKKIRGRIACILFLYRIQYFLTFLRQNIQQKVLVFHSGLAPGSMLHAPNPVAIVQIQYYIHIFK